MGRRHFLKKKPNRRVSRRVPAKPTAETLLDLLNTHVINPLVRMGMSNIQAMALAVSEPNEEDPASNPSHPACADVASSDYCHESWQLHLAKLKSRPETHWGTCQHGRDCAVIPVVCGNRCLAVVKLAGPASPDKSELHRVVELVELLVRDFAASQVEFLGRVPGGATMEESSQPSGRSSDRGDTQPRPTHPQVIRALEYIDAHLSDPRLTVARVASALDISPAYLSEIFVEQAGQRMSRHIAVLRVNLAKKLLETTEWQVKRVALETGHANPNWFCHIFSVHTGMTPGQYRSEARLTGTPPGSDR